MRLLYARLDAVVRQRLLAQPITAAPPAYHERLRRKHHPDARVETLAGLWLLSMALQRAGWHQIRMADLAIDAHKRPYFAQGPAFSISHTTDWVACALIEPGDAAHQVGLDLEWRRAMPIKRMLRLSQAAEHAAISAQPMRFFDYWCAREATVKASGRVGLKRIRQVRLAGASAELQNQTWQLLRPAIAPQLAVCLACDAPAPALHIEGPLSPL